jgi:hypothetical protein
VFPEATILVTGVEDPESGAHGPNESLHLGEFARVCLAEALLLAQVAETVERETVERETGERETGGRETGGREADTPQG